MLIRCPKATAGAIRSSLNGLFENAIMDRTRVARVQPPPSASAIGIKIERGARVSHLWSRSGLARRSNEPYCPILFKIERVVVPRREISDWGKATECRLDQLIESA